VGRRISQAIDQWPQVVPDSHWSRVSEAGSTSLREHYATVRHETLHMCRFCLIRSRGIAGNKVEIMWVTFELLFK
jgi:hypothetical protein